MRKKRKTKESFTKESKEIHGNWYDYSKVDYLGCNKEVIIICPKHGEFKQKPQNHLSKRGCYFCGREKTINSSLSNTKDFIKKANTIHNNFYNYDKTEYINAKKDLIITCPIHGDFLQKPNYHLSKNGCLNCYKDRNGFGREQFIKCCKNNEGTFYIIKCWNEEEEFIKIGITSKTVEKRFKSFKKFPYNILILKILKDDPFIIFNKEKEILKFFKKEKYIPLFKFKGSSECFYATIENKIYEI